MNDITVNIGKLLREPCSKEFAFSCNFGAKSKRSIEDNDKLDFQRIWPLKIKEFVFKNKNSFLGEKAPGSELSANSVITSIVAMFLAKKQIP